MKCLFTLTRLKSGMEQIEFAKILGCTQGTISKIEKTEAAPSAVLYVKLLRNFDLKGI